jgi:hypothetical protein
VSEADWKYVNVKTKSGKVMHMKMGSKLEERKIKENSKLVDKFSDTFAWEVQDVCRL